MCGFKPRADWVREMKRYGVLLEGVKPEHVRRVSLTASAMNPNNR